MNLMFILPDQILRQPQPHNNTPIKITLLKTNKNQQKKRSHRKIPNGNYVTENYNNWKNTITEIKWIVEWI